MNLPRTPSFRLDGKRAIVTGAGRGIGLAAAAALADAGAAVVLVARSSAEIEQAAAAIGNGALAATLDVSDTAAVSAFFAEREPFHVLVNNAGTNRPKPMWDVTEADYDAVLDLNLKAAFFVAQACARRMIETGTQGSLIHMGSQMGHVGGPNRSLYCASKWALEGMNKAYALDLAQHNPIRIHETWAPFPEVFEVAQWHKVRESDTGVHWLLGLLSAQIAGQPAA